MAREQAARPTPAAEFRRMREEGELRTLVSTGRMVILRPVRLMRMLQKGRIPDHLSEYVARQVWGPDDAEDTRTATQKAVQWQEYLDMVVSSALVYPVLSDAPQGEDQIGLDDLEYEEMLDIHEFAIEPTKAVRSFRGKQGSDVGVGDQGGEVRQAA